MNKFLKFSLISTAVLAGVYFGIALALIYRPVPTFESDPIPAPAGNDADHIPPIYEMRDGETLFARQFPADSDTTILLIHGVTSDSTVLSSAAQLLGKENNAEVIALDLRGHGRSGGVKGHVDYIGQYEDDVADVITAIRAERPNGQLILAGHSMGGGIALRFARLTERPEVDGYLLFAPHLGPNSPTMPEANPETAELAAAYSQLHVPRLIGLIMLNSVGIKRLNHLDLLYFNLTDDVTHTYSYGATLNSSPQEHGPELAAVNVPMLIVVGSNDEAFVATEYPTAVAEFSDGAVHIVDGENHNSILESPDAMKLVIEWVRGVEVACSDGIWRG